MPPAYSIVIPAYNESERLPATLDRILVHIQERGWSAEILVVDDGSTDDTVAIVQSYAQKYPSLRLVKNPGIRRSPNTSQSLRFCCSCSTRRRTLGFGPSASQSIHS